MSLEVSENAGMFVAVDVMVVMDVKVVKVVKVVREEMGDDSTADHVTQPRRGH